MKKADLINAITDLNNVLEPDPAISTDGTLAQLKAQLATAAALLTEDDVILNDTAAVLEGLDIEFQASLATSSNEENQEEVTEDPELEETEKEDAPEPEEKEWKESALADKVTACKKLGEIRQLVNTYPQFLSLRGQLVKPEFNGLQGPKNLKATCLEMLGGHVTAPEKADKPAKVKKDVSTKSKRATSCRMHSVLTAMRELRPNTTPEEINKKANEIHVKAGGTSNDSENKFTMKYAMQVLEFLEIAEQKDGKIVFSKDF